MHTKNSKSDWRERVVSHKKSTSMYSSSLRMPVKMNTGIQFSIKMCQASNLMSFKAVKHQGMTAEEVNNIKFAVFFIGCFYEDLDRNVKIHKK